MPTERAIPSELHCVFERHLDLLQEAQKLYFCAQTGMLFARYTVMGWNHFKELAAKIVGKSEEPSDFDWEGFQRDANAQKEQGFSLLHATFAVNLWATLEALVEDVLIALFKAVPETLNRDCLQKTQIPLALYESLSGDDRLQLLLYKLQDQKRSEAKNGVNRFEVVLEEFDLAVVPSDETRRALIDLMHVRNVILHRGHLVDRRFVEACPKFGLKAGEKLTLKDEHINGYVKAIAEYGQGLMDKCYKVYGRDFEIPAKPHSPEASPPPQ
jgi:hypothetical protein